MLWQLWFNANLFTRFVSRGSKQDVYDLNFLFSKYLANNLVCLLKCIQHFGRFFASLGHELTFSQQLVHIFGFVQLLHEFALQVLFLQRSDNF